jgi:hypothetical protein
MVKAMLPGLIHHDLERAEGRLGPAADDPRAGYLDPKLRHLDVVPDVLQLAPDHIGDQGVDRVASDVHRG